MAEKSKTKYVCSIYDERPETCIKYPWNLANQIFFECQFLNKTQDGLLSKEELLETKTNEEIGKYCVECGKCCFFGPAACSMLKIIRDED